MVCKPSDHNMCIKEVMMTLESLPNEVFIQCFEYLHYSEIFYSFERLNSRLTQLIENIYFHLNFQHVKKSVYDQFCRRLLQNPWMKRQISSLKLSSESATCEQISAFFRDFSLDQFSGLQSLTLIDIRQAEYAKIQSHFPSLSNLRSISVNYSHDVDLQNFHTLPKVNKVTLSIRQLHFHWSFVQQTLPITDLIIAHCTSLDDLTRLFKFAPNLRSLRIAGLCDDDSFLNDTIAFSLKRFVLRAIGISFDRFEMLLKKMPNLKELILQSSVDGKWINANHWEHLISSSLLHLTKFQFLLELLILNPKNRSEAVNEVLEKFQEFQSDFWHKQHQWFTAYELKQYMLEIYSIPYILKDYHLSLFSKRSPEHSLDCITNIVLDNDTLQEDFSHYFPNVKSLRLNDAYSSSSWWNNSPNDRHDEIQSLKKRINLSNLIHLDLGMISKSEILFMLLKIFQESPQLSSLRVDADHLMSIMDGELTEYLKKQIRKFHVCRINNQTKVTSEMVEKISEVMTSIEQLYIPIERSDDLKQLLTRLPNLSSITVQYLGPLPQINPLLDDILTKRHKTYLFDIVQHVYDLSRPLIHIWIGNAID